MKPRLLYLAALLLPLGLSASLPLNTLRNLNPDREDDFRLTSSTFHSGGTLPLSMILNAPSPTNPNVNACTVEGSAGGDRSPELSWTGAPEGTRSFVVILFDVTASFTHWGMYNISSKTTSLPVNAGVAGGSFGAQVANDFGDLSYDGPCPPTTLTPLSHHYVFTLYALDTKVEALPTFGNFPPGSEALYHALIKAGKEGHILAEASDGGFYSAAAPPGPAL